ncbi:hypothetical protein D3C80_1643020 [compost metagenome]
MAHHFRLDINAAVIQGSSIHLFTGVGILRVEDDYISAVQDIFLIAAQQISFTLFNKPDNVIVMKMIGEFLHNSFKTVGLQLQLCVKNDGPDFTSQLYSPSFPIVYSYYNTKNMDVLE